MGNNHKTFYEFGPFRVDASEQQLWRDGSQIPLTPKAFSVLFTLVSNSGRTLLKDELLREVWPDQFVEENNLADNISTLRRVLGDDAKEPRYIKTVPRRGYRFVADVREMQDEGVELVVAEHTRARIVIEEEINEVADTVGESSHTVAASAQISPTPITAPQSHRHRRGKALALLALALIVSGSGMALMAWRGLFRRVPQEDERHAVTAAQEMTITPVTNSGKMGLSTISPNGKLIAYAQNYLAGTGSLYVRQSGSNHEIQLLEPGKRIYGGTAFSPDSESIYYVVYDSRDLKGALYRINALGGPPVRLLEDISSMFSLSPDGRSATFYRSDPARKRQSLMIAKLDGSGDEQILLTRSYSEVAFSGVPAWSPDGRMIAFSSAVTPKFDNSEPASVYGFDLASGETKPLTNEHWANIGKMCWMPDGSGLVLIAFRQHIGNQLYYLSYPAGEARRITSGVQGFGNYGLGITSDASSLVADMFDTSAQLWIVGADGDSSRAIQLTTGDYDGRRGATWLADGRIIYVARDGGEYDFWTIKEDGTDAKPLTADSFLDREVTATPDGRFLVFTSDRESGSHIFRADTDGARPQQLTFGEAQDDMPDSSPDGQWIVYASSLKEKTTVWKVSIEGGTPVQLTDYECVAPSFSPDGKFISCIIPSESIPQKGSIAIIPAEGGLPVRSFNVVPFSWSYLSARWTHDGQALIFRDAESIVNNLWKQSLAGGAPSQLTNFKTGVIFNYAFTRDGRRLVLSRGQTIANVALIRNFR